MNAVSFIILLVAISFGVFGQLSLKRGMGATRISKAQNFLRQAINPSVFGGFAFYGLSTLLYFVAIARLDLSLAKFTNRPTYATVFF